jgi:hypothetical protein
MRAANLTQLLSYFALERTGLHGQNLRLWFIDRPTSPRRRLRQSLLEARRHQRAEKMLLVGHRGCGKSTELNQLVSELGDEYLALNFDLLLNAGRTTIGYEDLMLALATQVIRFCIDNKLFGRPLSDPLNEVMSNVKDWWLRLIAGLEIRTAGGVSTYAELTTLLGELQLGVSQSSLTREQIRDRVNQQMPELIRRVNLVVGEAQRTLGERRLLIIIEGLDKIDLESARNIFRDHAPTITSIDASTIFTFPLALRHADDYQQVRNTFEQKVRVLHNFAPRHPDGAPNRDEIDLLKSLVLKRAEERLIEADALDFLVEICGGIPSHLIQLVQNAVLFARQRNERTENITLVDAKAAAKEMRDEMIIGLSNQEWDLLWARRQDHAPVNEPAMQKLFYKSALVEYTNDEPWCDVHPLLWSILMDRYGR